MRPKPTVAQPPARKSARADRHRERIRADLSRRGVASEFSASICDRLAPFSEDLTPELYDAVLSGVAMAYGVHRRGAEASRENGTNFREVERLMGGFVSELRKLDETLETLAAYVSRLRTQTGPDDPVH
jgi:hypothetical protein